MGPLAPLLSTALSNNNCQYVHIFQLSFFTAERKIDLEPKPYFIDTAKWKKELNSNGSILCLVRGLGLLNEMLSLLKMLLDNLF